MLKVTKQQQGANTVVTLSGTIDDTDDMAALIGECKGMVVFNCAEITRINSVAVKNWIKYFTSLQKARIFFAFDAMPFALVEQLNAVRNFNCDGEVRSVIMAFRCSKCDTVQNKLQATQEIKKNGFNVTSIKCPQCGGEAEFDDIAEEYFSFLKPNG